MGLLSRLDPELQRKMYGFALSAAVHAALLIAIMVGGRHYGIDAGDVPTSQLVLLEAPQADQRDGAELPPVDAIAPTQASEERIHDALAQLAPPPSEALLLDEAAEPTTEEQLHPEPSGAITVAINEIPAALTMAPAERVSITQRLERLAAQALKSSRAEVTWEQDGRQYSALLVRERANEGTALERVTAQVSAADRGRLLTTLINLNRLAFSQFTQMVDRWDPMVQLHDDEIVGRFHTNSRFNMLTDSSTAPKFLGKVTTTARSFNAESTGRRRDSEIFRGGIEMGASSIDLPESLMPFEWAPREEGARVHELATDTHIRFFRDGSYSWRAQGAAQPQYLNDPSTQPVYFIGANKSTLYVQGIVAGKVLVYSPQRIVIEGSLTYAHDPREQRNAPDYLGLVSDRYVEVAGPATTGGGDLEIHAAIFAGRRFTVTNIDHPRTATLRIYGSLAAGTLSATEPRYATRIDYDNRFEKQRPPGFPSTNRYEVADWDGQWTERPERNAGN
jgi:hypothetical protein